MLRFVRPFLATNMASSNCVCQQALVTAYPEGCKTRRQLMKENKEIKEKCRPEYPLDIFETGRRADGFAKDPDAESE